jgi:hypothetical protein
MQRKKSWLVVLLLCLNSVVCLTFFCFSFSTQTHEETTYPQSEFAGYYRLYSPPIPRKLDFAGEIVPIDRYDVREALDRELLINIYWQSSILQYCKRANRFFPVIEPILKQHGIPDDFKYLALAESGFLDVVSPAKAAGFWQFMKATGIKYGLEINEEVDERYNLSKATVAACQYLKNSYKMHRSWTLAAAGYNMGDNGVKKACIEQHTHSYWDLLLNTETARYLYRIIALKLILSSAQEYGIFLKSHDLYHPIPTYTLQVDTPINNLYDFALQQNISYKQLKTLNPWLISNQLANNSKTMYRIEIPQKE